MELGWWWKRLFISVGLVGMMAAIAMVGIFTEPWWRDDLGRMLLLILGILIAIAAPVALWTWLEDRRYWRKHR